MSCLKVGFDVRVEDDENFRMSGLLKAARSLIISLYK